MRPLKICLLFILLFSIFTPYSVNAAKVGTLPFPDEKEQIAYLQKGNILSKQNDLNGFLTRKEFSNWLQFFTYDEKSNLISNSNTDPILIKKRMTDINFLTTYTNWEKSGLLNKNLTFKEMVASLYSLKGKDKLSDDQYTQLIKSEKLVSDEEFLILKKTTSLNKKIAAIVFARFLRQSKTITNDTSSSKYTSDKIISLREGPSAKFQNVIDIPKNKQFIILANFGAISICSFNGKTGYSFQKITSKYEQFEVTANKVNVRTGPSISYPVMKMVNLKDQIKGFHYNSDWIEYDTGNGKGFLSSKYVKKVTINSNNPKNDEDSENLLKKVYVIADKLNIRTEQSTTSKILETVSKGEELEVITTYPNWTKVKSKNVVGYVKNDYISNKPLSINKELVITIDAGHGGKDPGTHFGDLNEKDITLDTAIKVRDLFNNSNVKVVLTRDTDQFIDLNERVTIAKNNKSILFVSIHVNSGSGEMGGGLETYYYANQGKNPFIADSQLLANSLQTNMLNAWKLTNRGVHHGNFQVIRDNSMPAVLTELGFIDSKNDQQMLSSTQQRTIIAGAIHDGIIQYLINKGLKVK